MSAYDWLMAPLEAAGLRTLRQLMLAHATGRVLEVGAGTGANLGFYPVGCQLTLTDPIGDNLRIALNKAPPGSRLCIVRSSGEELPFASQSFDTVVATLTLCSVARPQAALQEVARVLQPGGQLLLLEHVRGGPLLGWLQDLATPAWKLLAGGCHLNRATAATVVAAGFIPRYERTMMLSVLLFGLYTLPANDHRGA
jgi:ubiquinone/menaquinone biosynthesis C-methylase UbiE